MASYNKVMLIGNLTRDPEVRYTPKGSAVCDIGLAVNRVYTSDSGEKVEEVTFVDVVLWAKMAELAGKYLHKGRPVFIEGRLQMDSWEDKQTGQKVTIAPQPARPSALRQLSNSVRPSVRLRRRRTMISVKARSPMAWKMTTFRFEICRR